MSKPLALVCVVAIGVITLAASLASAVTVAPPVCDFENPADRECNALGFDWLSAGGHPTITNSVNHTPGGGSALYNNGNGKIAYAGIAIDTMWITSWTRFPASTVEITGVGTVALTPGVWQQVAVGSGGFEIIPKYNSQNNFGTFAVDDLNGFVPEPASAALLAMGVAAIARRRRRARA